MNGRFDCEGLPVLQNTKLGYILSGKTHQCHIKKYKNQSHSFSVQTDSLHHTMEQFWAIEEMNTKIITQKERACEEHFQQHTQRLETGRYEVRLQLSESVDKLGESYDKARSKFLALEQRLLKNSQLKQDYSAFLEEYLQHGHMAPLSGQEVKIEGPHFPCLVMKFLKKRAQPQS